MSLRSDGQTAGLLRKQKVADKKSKRPKPERREEMGSGLRLRAAEDDR